MSGPLFSEEYDLTYSAPVEGQLRIVHVTIRVFDSSQGKVVVATQPFIDEDAVTITHTQRELIELLYARYGGYIHIEHYNNRSFGLDCFQPAWNRVFFEIQQDLKARIIANPPMGIDLVSNVTGLSVPELLVM